MRTKLNLITEIARKDRSISEKPVAEKPHGWFCEGCDFLTFNNLIL